MSRVCVLLAVVAVAASANPVLGYIVHEFSTHPGDQWVELHMGPAWDDTVDMRGWRIVTEQSECTLDVVLAPEEYVVVDSASLADGRLGRGELRLNPEGDSILLTSDSTWEQRMHYPERIPWRVPAPPRGGSAALWSNYVSMLGGTVNWYIDSTPTPGQENDDYSVIAGMLYDSLGRPLEIRYFTHVQATGAGLFYEAPVWGPSRPAYRVEGLRPGTYALTASVCGYGSPIRVDYPDSVEVGYSQTVSGIDFVIPVVGISEETAGGTPMKAETRMPTVMWAPDLARLEGRVFDMLGREVTDRRERLAPGVYFVRGRATDHTSKVVVQ
jgi:hypothetical protein